MFFSARKARDVMFSLLKSIADMFVSFFETVVTLLEFLLDTISGIADMLLLVAQSVVQAPLWIARIFPPVFVSGCVTMFGVVVLYKIIGREG